MKTRSQTLTSKSGGQTFVRSWQKGGFLQLGPRPPSGKTEAYALALKSKASEVEDPALQAAGPWERAGQCWEEANLPEGWSVGLPVTGNGAEVFGDLAEQTKEKELCLRQSACTKFWTWYTNVWSCI